VITQSYTPAPFLLWAAIRWLDSADHDQMGVLELGAHDEPAHLATSALVLLALFGPTRLLQHRASTATAMASSVLIDLDHLPLYVEGFPVDVAVDGGRPFTHSLSTVAGLGALAAGVRWRRTVLAAASGGVVLHFVRDIATGEGLPLWWPWEHKARKIRYEIYSRTLLALAGVAAARVYREAAH
jgi:inner membrane protein